MIFVHQSEAPRSFWMKNCMFNIDLIYLDNSGRIVAAHQMKKEPPKQPSENTKSYTERLKKHLSNEPARYALEFPPGTITRLKLKPGMIIPLPHQNLRAMTP